jgi:fatty-acyl-CoA synthase
MASRAAPGCDTVERLAKWARTLRRLPAETQALRILFNAGIIGLDRPDRLLAMYRAVERYGPIGGSIGAAAIRHGNRPALVDELGSLSYADLDRRSNALANALRARGIGTGDGVGILCRNHRGVYDATFGALKAGARAVFLNTDFAGPQAAEVCAREGVDAVIYDEEFAGMAAGIDAPRCRFVAWTDGSPSGPGNSPALQALMTEGSPAPPPPPRSPGSVVILTSGTTGTPKGASRSEARSFTAVAAILSRIPFQARQSTFVAAPVYHGWGLGMSLLAVALGSTLIVRRRFDAEATLVALEEHRCTALAVVPVLLRRLLSVGEDRIAAADLSALRIIASSGAQLDRALATRALDAFGDVVYNLYGSTEVAWATIATPAELRSAPGCAGRPPLGTVVRILDEQRVPVVGGTTGRIFVSSGMEFSGYTGGGGKEVVDGLMATGDVGHFDRGGRLFIDGRDDEMIVSGGENVFPAEVEELLSAHEAVVEAAAIGVPDQEFGQRLRVFVVIRPGHALDGDGVRAHVRANLARSKVPRDVVFVDQLPRNPSGKVLKRQLATADAT